ncbi:MAG: UbiA family prenyltransferase, partial [Nitrospira sp.]
AWAIAYDTIYAIQDQEDDRRVGVKSAALYFGDSVHQGVGLAFSIMLACLIAAGWFAQLRWPYYAALLGVSVFFILQVMRLRRPMTPTHAFAMFRAHVWAGAAILLGLLVGLVG